MEEDNSVAEAKVAVDQLEEMAEQQGILDSIRDEVEVEANRSSSGRGRGRPNPCSTG